MKSSPGEIRSRFDADVGRFTNLETGQSATVDAPLALELIAEAAVGVGPRSRDLLDLGCGGGNYALKILQRLPGLNVTLLDLSRPMLDRAVERVSGSTSGLVQAVQGDIREVELAAGSFDIVTAAAVLHHLRGEAEWRAVFSKIYQALRSGGSLWISDLVAHEHTAVQTLMWRRYGEYLAGWKDAAYRDQVFAYVEKEDSPRSLEFQLEMLRAVGFSGVEILHKNACFATFGAIKGADARP